VARIFIGVAWPYANGPFHLGHLAGAYLPGDIFARYHRLAGDEVLMVSGSDMHGTPVLVIAEQEGSSPEAVARRNDAINREAFRSLGITFDVFTSTRTPLHERTVHELFLGLLRNGYIDRRTEEYAYCPTHARFLPDRYLTGTCPHCGSPRARGDECDQCGRVVEPRELGSPRCALDGTPAEFRPSEHFFLRLDKLAAPLERFLADKQHWRPNVSTFTQNFRKAGLRATPITRDLDWGVTVPLDGYPTKRFYVWFEAVIGYLSASREWAVRRGTPESWRRFWDEGAPTRTYYFVGKDNIYHHTLFWPAILLGVGGLRLPYDVPANEWLVLTGEKLSKSRGGGSDVTVAAMLREYPADAIRFYAALMAPENHDTEFRWEEFHTVLDQVLANQWGNLVQRLLVFARDRFGGTIPQPPPGYDPSTAPLAARLAERHARITEELEAVHLKAALELALEEVREANRRFHEAAPWRADEAAQRRAVYEGIWFLRTAALWLAPVLPWSSSEVYRMLGYSEGPRAGDWARAIDPPPAGQRLGEIRPLFPRLDRSAASPSGGGGAASSAPAGPSVPTSESLVASNQLPPLEIRAGRVVAVAAHPSADRLYRLEVDLGALGRRTVVAGLRPYLPPEALEGTTVLLLANLAPRTIRSVTSHGMILAAEGPQGVALLHPPEGTEVGTAIEGTPAPARTITIEEFERASLRVGRVLGPVDGERSRISVGDAEVTAPGRWAPGENVVIRVAGVDPESVAVIAFGPERAASVDPKVPPGARVR
jgi:methionyl-tRNA synthetase